MRKIFLLAISFCFVITLFAKSSTSNDPFEGFKTMTLPRQNVPVGALWNISMESPVGMGVNPEFLQVTNSYKDFSQVAEKDFSTSLNLGLLNFISANGSYSSTSKSNFKIEGVSIVTLNSIDILRKSVGQYVLYEAIKVNEISTIIENSKELEIQADLKKIFKDIDITSEAYNRKQKILEIKGVDLYIAYRVVKVEKTKTSQTKLKFSSQGYSTNSFISLSSTYLAKTGDVTVQVCPCAIQNCLAETSNSLSECANEKGYDFTVILKNQIDMTKGTPLEFRFKVYAGEEISNVNKSLYSIPTSEGLEIAYLNIERMIFAPLTGTLIYMLLDKDYRKAYLFTTKFKFGNYLPKSSAGW